MRRFILQATLCAGLLFLALPAHSQESQAEQQETALLDRVGRWKIINTAIFVILAGWWVSKKAPAFFNARSADIQKAIKDATGLKLEADYRYSEIDRKMANLAEEVNNIRSQAETEMEREHSRIQRETELEAKRIRHAATNEVEALRKEAADHLQFQTAQLALADAERRLTDRFAYAHSTELLDDFVRLIDRSAN